MLLHLFWQILERASVVIRENTFGYGDEGDERQSWTVKAESLASKYRWNWKNYFLRIQKANHIEKLQSVKEWVQRFQLFRWNTMEDAILYKLQSRICRKAPRRTIFWTQISYMKFTVKSRFLGLQFGSEIISLNIIFGSCIWVLIRGSMVWLQTHLWPKS